MARIARWVAGLLVCLSLIAGGVGYITSVHQQTEAPQVADDPGGSGGGGGGG